MCENDGSIKIALCEVVTALMSPDPNERKLAEHQIDALQVTEGKQNLNLKRSPGKLLGRVGTCPPRF